MKQGFAAASGSYKQPPATTRQGGMRGRFVVGGPCRPDTAGAESLVHCEQDPDRRVLVDVASLENHVPPSRLGLAA
jgi:hypothetical protein